MTRIPFITSKSSLVSLELNLFAKTELDSKFWHCVRICFFLFVTEEISSKKTNKEAVRPDFIPHSSMYVY